MRRVFEGRRRDPGGCNESSSYRSRHCSIGRRRWQRVGHSSELSSAVPDCKLRFVQWRSVSLIVPSSSTGPRTGHRRRAQHCSKQWNSSVSATTRWQRWRDVSRLRNAQWQGRMLLHQRRVDPMAPLPQCDEEMQEWRQGRHAELQAAVAEEISWKWREFPSSSPLLLRVEGVDQPTVGCNSIFCCKCLGINGCSSVP